MQLDLSLNLDLSKLYANDKYEKLSPKQAKEADRLIKQALMETANRLKWKLVSQDGCYDTTGMKHDSDFTSLTPHLNCVHK
jgi:hypothetical protein